MDEKARESNRLRQRKFLELHKEEVNARRREKYHERISNGKCPRCGGKVKKGRTLCPDCCEYMLNLNRKYIHEKWVAEKPPVKAEAKRVKMQGIMPGKKQPAKITAKAGAAKKARQPR